MVAPSVAGTDAPRRIGEARYGKIRRMYGWKREGSFHADQKAFGQRIVSSPDRR